MLEKLREWMRGICPAIDWSNHMPLCPNTGQDCDKGCEWSLVDHGYMMTCKRVGETDAVSERETAPVHGDAIGPETEGPTDQHGDVGSPTTGLRPSRPA